MGQSLEKVVCANAKALLLHHWPDEGILAKGVKSGLGKGTVERIIKDDARLKLGVIETLAKSCNLEPWQLLVPNLDPVAPPMLAEAAAAERAKLHALRLVIGNPEQDSLSKPRKSPETGRPPIAKFQVSDVGSSPPHKDQAPRRNRKPSGTPEAR